jgi:hypothetical protein
MRTILCTLSFGMILLAGCVDFAGSVARNRTVKDMPPEIDPKLPGATEEPGKLTAPIPADPESDETADPEREGDAAPRAMRRTLTEPLTAEQIDADNAYQAVEVLRREIDRDESGAR